MSAALIDYISYLTLSGLISQSVNAAVLLIPAILVSRMLRGHCLHLITAAWIAVLVRLVIPPRYDAVQNVAAWLDSLAGAFGTRPDNPLTSKAEFISLFSGPAIPGVIELSWNTCALLAYSLLVIAIAVRQHQKRTPYIRIANSTATRNESLIAIVADWRNRLAVSRRVRLVVSDKAETPYTVGVLQPAVVLPTRLVDELGPRQIEAVIAHEMAHVRRCDDLWIRLESWLSCFFFFHPAVWLSRNELRQSREIFCDRMVMSVSGMKKSTYAQSLLNIIELRADSSPGRVAAGHAGSYAECRRRLHDLSTASTAMPPWSSRLVICTTVFLLVLVFPFLPTSPGATPQYLVAHADDVSSLAIDRAVSPVEGSTLLSPFGTRYLEGRGLHFHTGIDLAAPIGRTVRTILPGIVEKAVSAHSDETSMVFGGYVVIRHVDGLTSTYSPLSNIAVQAGDSVSRSDSLGTLSDVFFNRGPAHLHFELSLGDKAIDPQLIIDAATRPEPRY